MGLDNFTSDGPRTYTKGGRRDPNSTNNTSQINTNLHDGVVHIPSGMDVPDLVNELNLKPIRVQRLDSSFSDSLFFATKGNRMATSFEAMVKVDKLNNQDIDGINELVDLILEKADEGDYVSITPDDDNDELDKSTKASNDDSQGGIAAFM